MPCTQTSVPGFTGVIVNETTFTLLVDLAVTSTHIINGTEMFGGLVGQCLSLPSETVAIIGNYDDDAL